MFFELTCFWTAFSDVLMLSIFVQVFVEKRWVEMRDIGKGIVELIEQHAVTKLVMGAAADKHYIE